MPRSGSTSPQVGLARSRSADGPTSARSRAWASVAAVVVATATVCCAALAASSAPLAICSMARRSSSAADADWVIPLASSSVAAAIRSSIFCWRPAELADGDGFRCRPLALAAEDAGAAPERPDAIPLVARLVVFMSDFGPRLAKCAAASGVPDNLWGPNWVCGSDRSRSTLDRAPFCPARSTPYGFLRTEHLFKNDALMGASNRNDWSRQLCAIHEATQAAKKQVPMRR